MTRLQSELTRLYLPTEPAATAPDDNTLPLADAHGHIRALVLEVARPADWDAASRVWVGVQQDLALPAPGIAISGTEGYQLWFSLAAAVPVAQGHAFLEALRQRYLGDLPPHRVTLVPTAGDMTPRVARVPAVQASGDWSAFVAPDLAPVFADTPWLDIVPGDDGQADLLRRLESLRPAHWAAALATLGVTPAPPPAGSAGNADVPAHTRDVKAGTESDPARFLLRVMNDDGVPMALRIEAAKALLATGR